MRCLCGVRGAEQDLRDVELQAPVGRGPPLQASAKGAGVVTVSFGFLVLADARLSCFHYHSLPMAPATVARRLALLVTSLRGNPTGDEGQLVDNVPARLGELPKKARLSQQQKWLCWGLALIADYAVVSFSLNVPLGLGRSGFR